RVPVAPLPSMSEYPEFQYDTSSRLNATMMNNVKEYKRIKEIHNFIVSKQNGVDLDSVTALPVSTPYTRVYPREALPKPLVTFESSIGLAKQVSGHILAHTGFDSVTDSALSTFADIFMELLFTAGKTMRAYMDEHGNDMTIEEILSLVLVELGILDCGELQKYINHELVGFGKKLYDLRRKLESAWTEFGQLIKSADEEGDVQLDEDGIM
ncbi:Transcriptional activator spt7, partial [Globomyces sp. JEL0801]